MLYSSDNASQISQRRVLRTYGRGTAFRLLDVSSTGGGRTKKKRRHSFATVGVSMREKGLPYEAGNRFSPDGVLSEGTTRRLRMERFVNPNQ